LARSFKILDEKIVIDRNNSSDAIIDVIKYYCGNLEKGITATISEQGFDSVKWTCYKIDQFLNKIENE
jgi:hypothetical protein